MANIPNQATFDGLLQANEARYEDTTSSVVQGVAITALENFAVTTPSIASDSNASTFTANNCFINLTDSTSTSSGDNWLGGALNLTNCTVNYSGGLTGTGIEYPGFRTVGGTALADRYTLNLSGSTLLCSRNNNARWTLHFQGAAPTGHNLTGTTFGFGVVPYLLYSLADLVGVTFSGQSAATGAPQGGISQTNFRIDNPAGSGGSAGAAQPVFTSVWWGLFGCNFTNWTDVTNTINVNQTTFSGHFANTNTPTFFVVDGQFSNEITTTGFRLGTNRDNYNFISGVSFNPRFRDDVTLVETTNDVFVDFGTRTIHAAQATRNFDTIPVETTSAGVRQVNGAGDNGFVIENTDANGRNTDQTTGTPRLSAPAFTGNAMRYWVYDLINYSTVDGSTNTVTPTARNWTNSMQFADFQNIDLPAETLLNGRSIADARTLNIDGAADARDFYPMTKALYNDDRDTNFPAFASTATNFNLGTVDLQIDTASNTDRPNAGDLRIHVGNTLDLAGLTITTDTFSLISGNVTMSNGTISMAAANFNGITFGNGIVIDQGVATNVPVANFAISNVPTLTFRGTPGANGISLTAVTITGGQFIPQQNLEVTQQQAMDFFGLTILPGNTGTSNGQTITVPAAPPVTVTLKPIGTIDDIRNAGGFWRVVNAAGTVVQTANITNTTTLDQVSFTQTSVQTDVFTWYYLPASVPGVSSFDFGTGTWMGTSMNFDANGINDSALTAGIDSTAVTYTTSNVDVSVSGSGTSQQLVITVNASATVSREQTQEIALVARNDVDYINTVVARGLGPFMRGATELSGRIIEFAQPFITAFNGDVPGALDPVSGDPNFEVIILRLNDAVTSPTGITNAVGYISQANGANPPVQFFDTTVVALSASIGQIQTAVDGSSRIQDIDNKTSYMVTDGATTNASTVGSNLFGIAPKDEDYDPNNNYITNT